MRFCYISTINSLNEISSLGDIEYALAPYILDSEEYCDYFRHQSQKDKIIIVDDKIAENGGELSFVNLIKAAVKVKATFLVIPDSIGNYKETKKKREEFLNKHYDTIRGYGIKLLGVAQGSTFQEYIDSLDELKDCFQVSLIGLPFRMRYADFKNLTKEENCMMNRYLFIQSQKFNKPVHLLGCNLIKESLIYLNDKRIFSMDSKLITRYALSNQKINFKDKVKPKKKLYIEDKLTKKQIKLAIDNIIKFKQEVEKYG